MVDAPKKFLKIFTANPFLFSEIVLSRAINFGRQCHFKIWLDCHKFKKFPNGAFSIASKNDLDDQNLLLATVHVIDFTLKFDKLLLLVPKW
jgi:hypothetical protein